MGKAKSEVEDLPPLRLAIVQCAISDYTKALRDIKVLMKHSEFRPEWTKEECEQFFLGQWFQLLCDLDPMHIIEQARKQAEFDEEEYQRWKAHRDAANRVQQKQ